jgi:hypothetical protein
VPDLSSIPLNIAGPLSGLLLVISLWLLLKNRRTVGTQPQCRKCDYLLIGLSSDRCPECGTPITPKSIVHGARQRRPGRIAAGCMGIALAVGTVWQPTRIFVQTTNFYQWKPTFMVMRDLRTGSGRPSPGVDTPLTRSIGNTGHGWVRERVDLARIAFEELLRRDKAGKLSATYRHEIEEMALASQTPNSQIPLWWDLSDYLSERMIAGDLSADQQARFYQRSATLTLNVRPTILLGDDVPIRMKHEIYLPCPKGEVEWLANTTCKSLKVNGDTLPSFLSWDALKLTPAEQSPDERLLPCSVPGHYQIDATVLYEIYVGPSGNAERGKLLHVEVRTASANFDVVAPTTENAIKFIDQPAMADKLRAGLSPIGFHYNIWHPGEVFGSIDFGTVPVNVAFDVFAKYGGKEYPIGHFAAAAGEYSFNTGGRCDSDPSNPLPKPPPTIDIVLRTNPAVARTTIDLFQIWNGEIDFPNIPINDDYEK